MVRGVLMTLAVLVLLTSPAASAQARGSGGGGTVASAEGAGSSAERLTALEDILASDPARYDARWQAAREYMTLYALESEEDQKREIAGKARGHALAATVLEAGLVEGHYWLAVASGGLADIEGGRTKIRYAEESWFEATWVLAADSTHAGAHHVKGRIHAGVRRANPIMRFLARILLGADALDSTSWEMAEYHLERAARLEPTPKHIFELALLYGDTDRPAKKHTELLRARDAEAPTPLDEQYIERAKRLLDSEGG